MDFKMVPRWAGGPKLVRGGQDSTEEREKLLIDTESDHVGYKARPPRTPRVRKAKLEDSFSDDDGSLIPLGPSSRPPRPPPIPDQCIEVEVQPGESLTSLSLKYNIPVAELKRVNNLINENEFFALKRFKIPVKPASLLTEILPGTATAAAGQTRDNGWIIKRASTPDTTGTGCTSSTVPSSPNSEAECHGELDEEVGLAPLHHPNYSNGTSKNAKKAKYFLKNVDKDLQRIREKQEALSQSTSSAEFSTGSPDFVPLPVGVDELQVQSSSHGGAACGIVFVSLVVIAVVIILLIAKHETFELEEMHHLTSRNHTGVSHVESHH